MNEYHSRGKEILKILINNGYEAYFVGEAVRNIILEKSIRKIEITTSAHIEIAKNIFNDCLIIDVDENTVDLKYAGFNYILKSFVNNNFSTNNVIGKHYSKNLLDDLASRDFSINAIAMSHSGKLTDAYNGYDDIKRRLISHIGNAKDRFYKDPSIMVKAFVLVSELNYKFVPKTKKAISKRRKNLTNCDVNLLLDDFKKMFEGVYVKKTLRLMCKLKVNKSIPAFKKVLAKLQKNYKKQTFEEVLLMADVLNGKMNDNFREYISDYDEYCKVYDLVVSNKSSKYDQLTLYTNGLKICLQANKINSYLGNSSLKERSIKKKWNNLPLRNVEELNYRVEDLYKIIRERDYNKVNIVLEEVAKLVLTNEIKNSRSDIEKTVIQVLQKNNIFYSLQGINNFEKKLNESFQDNIPKRYVSNDKNIETMFKEIKMVILDNEDYAKNINDPEALEKDLYDLLKNHAKKGEN